MIPMSRIARRPDSLRARRVAGGLLLGIGLLLGAMIAHGAFGLGGAGSKPLFVKWLYNIVLVGSASVCLLRGLTDPRERIARANRWERVPVSSDRVRALAAVRDAVGRTLDDQAVALLVQCLEHSHASL